jgi:heat shock protein HtpX
MNSRNYMKTTLLLAAMSAIVLFIGSQIGGGAYLPLALAFAILMNGVAYFFSDKIAILSARAKPVTESEYPELYRIVRGLVGRAGMPMPRLYVSPSQQPNAFATGRNPKHAAVAVTQGILPILQPRELEGVLAHELSHVKNRDILISSVAATMGAIIMFLARLAWFIPLGGGDRDRNPLAELALVILGPIAALLIQMAVTRSREFGADSSGAALTADPLALANALRKIEAYSRGTQPATTNPSTAHLFISNPFKFNGGGMARLFSTHPPTAERVARLEAMAYDPHKRP